MKGIRICGECANYSYKKHKCLLGCNKETDPRSKFYDDCPLPDAVEVKHGRNITEMHPVDEFVCSECGFIMQDFTEVHIDEDTRDTTYHECYIKYCPNCGAKMDGGENDGN